MRMETSFGGPCSNGVEWRKVEGMEWLGVIGEGGYRSLGRSLASRDSIIGKCMELSQHRFIYQ